MKGNTKNRIVAVLLIASLCFSISGCADSNVDSKLEESNDSENVISTSEDSSLINALGDSVEKFSNDQNPLLLQSPTPTQTPVPSATPIPTPTPVPSKPSDNIYELTFVSDDDIELVLDGPGYSGGIKVLALDKNNYSTSDIVFVFDDPGIAQVTQVQKSTEQKILFSVRPMAEGETYIYAETSDGLISSERRKVVVGPCIDVESVWIEEECTLELGDSKDLDYEILPDDASFPEISWTSSNSKVVTVDSNGHITGVGLGEAEITATASNGTSATCTVSVVYTRRVMTLDIKRSQNQGEYIGSEWSHSVMIDGEHVKKGEYTVMAGETLEIYCESIEDDAVPDIGEETVYYTVTEEDLENGFTVEVVVEITENRGKNAGKTAQFTTTLVFSA